MSLFEASCDADDVITVLDPRFPRSVTCSDDLQHCTCRGGSRERVVASVNKRIAPNVVPCDVLLSYGHPIVDASKEVERREKGNLLRKRNKR